MAQRAEPVLAISINKNKIMMIITTAGEELARDFPTVRFFYKDEGARIP